MKYVIQIIGLAGGPAKRPTEHDGRYLEAYDPDAHGGSGAMRTTDDPEKALTFDNASAALELWRKQSLTRPLRTDGKPNRPLTAFTVSVMPRNAEPSTSRS